MRCRSRPVDAAALSSRDYFRSRMRGASSSSTAASTHGFRDFGATAGPRGPRSRRRCSSATRKRRSRSCARPARTLTTATRCLRTPSPPAASLIRVAQGRELAAAGLSRPRRERRRGGRSPGPRRRRGRCRRAAHCSSSTSSRSGRGRRSATSRRNSRSAQSAEVTHVRLHEHAPCRRAGRDLDRQSRSRAAATTSICSRSAGGMLRSNLRLALDGRGAACRLDGPLPGGRRAPGRTCITRIEHHGAGDGNRTGLSRDRRRPRPRRIQRPDRGAPERARARTRASRSATCC